MNTQKQVLIMSGLLLMMLVIVAIYAAWYPSRSTDAEDEFTKATTERGAVTFARNCRLCHGDTGEGGLLGGRLPAAPALNRPDLQGFKDSTATLTAELNPTATTLEVNNGALFGPQGIILLDEEKMQVKSVEGNTVTVTRGFQGTAAQGHFPGGKIWAFDEGLLEDAVALITNTISCGRVGTAMPPWAQDQGGTLSDEKIRQLMTLITTGGWEHVKAHDDVEDAIAAGLTAPLPAETTHQISDLPVADVTIFEAGDPIRVDQEQMIVVGLPIIPPGAEGAFPGTLTVSRGANGTTRQAHSTNTTVANRDAESEFTALTANVEATATPVSEMQVSDITRFNAGDAIRIGEERLRIASIPPYPTGAIGVPGTILVERGIYDTFAEEHTPETHIFKFPEAPNPPSINQASCGQTAKPTVAAGPCPDQGGTFQISASGTAFSCQEMDAQAGSQVTVAFTNQEATVHNIAFYTDESASTPLADGSTGQVPFAGPGVTNNVNFIAPSGTGKYYFHCDVHPQQMQGAFTVE
jgi:mono/diheme cytochrome c family protein/plastocyanin